MNSNIVPAGGGYQNSEVSPFDEIKHTDERGDWWSARELQSVAEYEQWRNFEAATIKARQSMTKDLGVSAAHDHIADSSKMIGAGKGAQREVPDYRLTRDGAYRVLQECDGRKPRIAEAKGYFANRTQEAELIDGMDRELRMIVEGAMELQRTRNELRQVQQVQLAQGQRQEQIEARVATLEGNHDWVSALGYARTHPPLCTDQRYLAKVGRVASRMARQQGVKVGKTSHPYFGEANTYPEHILEAAFTEIEASR